MFLSGDLTKIFDVQCYRLCVSEGFMYRRFEVVFWPTSVIRS